MLCFICFFFFKQKTAYELRISDWSSDVCSSDLVDGFGAVGEAEAEAEFAAGLVGALHETASRPHHDGVTTREDGERAQRFEQATGRGRAVGGRKRVV